MMRVDSLVRLDVDEDVDEDAGGETLELEDTESSS